MNKKVVLQAIDLLGVPSGCWKTLEFARKCQKTPEFARKIECQIWILRENRF